MKSIKKNLYEAIEYKKEHPEQSNTEIANKFGVDRHSLSLLNYEKYTFCDDEKYYWITEEEQAPVLYFINNPDKSLTAVANKFKVKTDTIKRRMKAMGYEYETRYKRQFNRQAFQNEITEQEAYWLGFLLADGYINEDRGFIKIKLGVIDKNHLLKFANFMQEDEAEKSLMYENGGAYEKNNVCVGIEYDSRELVLTLNKFNLYQNKSGNENPYHFNELNLQKAYIRGMIDGDGHIEDGYFKYVGSLESCQYVKDYFGQYLTYNENCSYIYAKEKIYSFELRRKEVNDIIYDLYKDAKVFLDRKYEIAVHKLRN